MSESPNPHPNTHPNNVVHFAIAADDVDRARAFYGDVFGWRFEAWGPPNFYMVYTGSDEHPGILGALEERHEAITADPESPGRPTGFRCTVAVADIAATRSALEAAGATITYAGEIPTVGKLVAFLDTEGNPVTAMQYDEPRY